MFCKLRLSILVLAFLCAWSLTARAAKSLSPEDLVAKHLNSIGSKQAISNVKSRVVTGQVEYRILSGGQGGVLDGSSTFLTEGRKILLYIKFPNNEYHGERFIFDGEHIEIRAATSRQSRSALGDLLRVQDVIIREGLLGGALSTAWPLLDLDEHKVRLSYIGLKDINGQRLHVLAYKPKKSTDLTIHLYFDLETFRHVQTVYTLSVRPNMAGVPTNVMQSPEKGSMDVGETPEIASARQFEIRYRLEERFSNFTTVDGLTLPTHYTVQFSQEQQNGATVLSQWDTNLTGIQENVSPDPRNFQVK